MGFDKTNYVKYKMKKLVKISKIILKNKQIKIVNS